MNKVIFVLVLLFLFLDSSAQDKLYLKNGDIVTGKITEINKTVVRIYSDKAGRRKRYTDKDIAKASRLIDGKDIEYTYEVVPTLGKVLLGKLFSGRVNLYTAELYVPAGSSTSNIYKLQHSLYFLKKENEENYFNPNYDGVLFNSFHNRVSKYFKDCPVLYKRIKTKLMTMSDLQEISEMYDTCND